MGRFNGNIQVYHEYYDPDLSMWIAGWYPVMGLRYNKYFSYSDRNLWRNFGTEDATSNSEAPTSTVSGHGIYLMVYHNGRWERVTKYQIRHDEYVEYIGGRINLLPANGYNKGVNYNLGLILEIFHIKTGTNTNQNLFYTGEGTPEQVGNNYFRVYYNVSSARFIAEQCVSGVKHTLTIPAAISQGAYYYLKLSTTLSGQANGLQVHLVEYVWTGSTWDPTELYNQFWCPWGVNYGYSSNSSHAYLGDTNVRLDVRVSISGGNGNDTGGGGSMQFNKNGWPSGDFINSYNNTAIDRGTNITDNATFSGLNNYAYTESTYTWE